MKRDREPDKFFHAALIVLGAATLGLMLILARIVHQVAE